MSHSYDRRTVEDHEYDEYLRQEEQARQEEEDAERWREEALRDPTSDAYYSDGAREARIDAGLEKP